MKPMLADALEGAPKFPLYASPKIDGIRCLIAPDGHLVMAVSRSLKPIRNQFVQDVLSSDTTLLGLDGELVVGEPFAKDCMQATSSGVMSEDGQPDFTFYVFDMWNQTGYDFMLRVDEAVRRVVTVNHPRIKWLPQTLIETQLQLDAFEHACLEQGYEGVMLRQATAQYKFGRSRNSDGALLKLKRFEDAEAVIIGFEEEMHNTNEATKNALGRTERSTSMAGMVGKGTLGALICRTPEGVEFNIGSGFTAAQRKALWPKATDLIGQLAKYRHFAAGGVKIAPRFPVFIGLRDPEDM